MEIVGLPNLSSATRFRQSGSIRGSILLFGTEYRSSLEELYSLCEFRVKISGRLFLLFNPHHFLIACQYRGEQEFPFFPGGEENLSSQDNYRLLTGSLEAMRFFCARSRPKTGTDYSTNFAAGSPDPIGFTPFNHQVRLRSYECLKLIHQ